MAGCGSGAAPEKSCDKVVAWAIIAAAVCRAPTKSLMPIPRISPATASPPKAEKRGRVRSRDCVRRGAALTTSVRRRPGQLDALRHGGVAKARHQRDHGADPDEDQGAAQATPSRQAQKGRQIGNHFVHAGTCPISAGRASVPISS
jgi:hypothetical protein